MGKGGQGLTFYVYPQCSHNSKSGGQNFAQTPMHQPERHQWDWCLGEGCLPLQTALTFRVPGAACRRAPAPSTALLLPRGGAWGRVLTSNRGAAWAAWSKLPSVTVLPQDNLYAKQRETSASRGAKRARKRGQSLTSSVGNGAGLLNSAFCFEDLPQIVNFRNRWVQP